MRFYLYLIFFLIISFSFAATPLKPTKIAVAPIIDGRLDDQAWQNVLTLDQFKTFAPDFGKDASQRTIAFAAYDSDNLYFAFRCYDTEPGKIKATMASRDNIRPDDWVCINLDSFFDQQSLYAFYVNPFGIQTDSRYAANIEDFSADYVWYSAGQLLPDGYIVEISLPLKSIRYSDDNPVTMSIFFERYISRLTEHSSFPELDPAKGMAFLTQMTPLLYNDLNHYKLFELLPAFTYSNKYLHTNGSFKQDTNHGELSLTTKYGITSDLILDGTYNPDFSQVEADAGQVDVNLRYALYYPEKRPFFLEGNEIYNLAATQTSEIDPIKSIVHTRSIVTPLTGIKLSGKIGSKNTIAMLYAMDKNADEWIDALGNYTHVPILRYKRSFSNDSYIGGIITDRETKDYFNRVGGIDGIVRLTAASTIEGNALFSSTNLGLNTKTIGGHAFGVRYNFDTRDISCDAVIKDISENFFAHNGYVTRNGVTSLSALVRPKIYPKSSFFQRIDLEAFSAQTKDQPSSLWETFNHASIQAYFGGALTAKIKYIYSTEIFLNDKFNTGGFVLNFGGQLTNQLSLSLSYRKVDAIYYSQNPYQGSSNRATLLFIYQPMENFELYTSILFSDFTRDSDSQLVYEYPIFYEKLTYQLNKYLFFRGIVQYNKFKKQLLTDFLISFTYVPGTVMHLGYGSLYEKTFWNEHENRYDEADNFLQINRGFFFKMSYLWRM